MCIYIWYSFILLYFGCLPFNFVFLLWYIEISKFGENRRRFSTSTGLNSGIYPIKELYFSQQSKFCPQRIHLPESTRFSSVKFEILKPIVVFISKLVIINIIKVVRRNFIWFHIQVLTQQFLLCFFKNF